METDDDLVPLSALQHLVFCERQAALIHVERLWREDPATAQGQIVHRRVDTPGTTFLARAGVRIARAVPLTSRRLGVFGVADMIELHEDPAAPHGVRPVPVEVKKGAMKVLRADEVQLCAQAMCLEEVFEVDIAEGCLFYAASHRRRRVPFDDVLRRETAVAARRMREIIAARIVPLPIVGPETCRVCSLEPLCMPSATRRHDRARLYLQRLAKDEA